jgi:hypothetical protein
MKTRRDALRSLAAATSLPVFAQQHHHHQESLLQIRQPAGPKYFSAADFRTVTVLVDLILPPTGTPGASAAHVDFYVDSAVAGKKSLQELFREGLTWLEAESKRRQAASFTALTEAQQTAILKLASEDLASSPGRFFETLKNLTIDGYYTSKEGLVQELGWHGNTFLSEFKGCTHPEHQG